MIHHIYRANQVIKGSVSLYLREDLASLFGDVQGLSVENTEFICTYNSKWNLVFCIVYRPGGVTGFSEAMRDRKLYWKMVASSALCSCGRRF